jgi:4-alpha-glucanotransferase
LESVICEDLGTLTTPVQHVLKRLNLSGIRVTQFSDPNNANDIFHGCNVAAHYWITPGSHDNEPLMRWAKTLVKSGQEGEPGKLGDVRQHAHWLAEELIREPEKKESFQHALSTDALALLEAKMAELFASPAQQVQLFFADLFGLEDVYNRPGTSGQHNWRLRVPKDFAETYFKGLKKGKALNLPAVMKMALEAQENADPQLLSELQQMAERLRAKS